MAVMCFARACVPACALESACVMMVTTACATMVGVCGCGVLRDAYVHTRACVRALEMMMTTACAMMVTMMVTTV